MRTCWDIALHSLVDTSADRERPRRTVRGMRYLKLRAGDWSTERRAGAGGHFPPSEDSSQSRPLVHDIVRRPALCGEAWHAVHCVGATSRYMDFGLPTPYRNGSLPNYTLLQ